MFTFVHAFCRSMDRSLHLKTRRTVSQQRPGGESQLMFRRRWSHSSFWRSCGSVWLSSTPSPMTQQGDLSTPMLLLYVTKQCVVIVAKSKSAHRFVSLRAYQVFKFCFVCSNVTQLRFIGSEVRHWTLSYVHYQSLVMHGLRTVNSNTEHI